jgi:hypothetical protein
MVTVGLTDTVPPVPGKVLFVPSAPVTVTLVAFVAVTVKVELDPAAIEAGFAVMLTVGSFEPAWTEPHPVTNRKSEQVTAMTSERVAISGRRAHTFIMVDLPQFR